MKLRGAITAAVLASLLGACSTATTSMDAPIENLTPVSASIPDLGVKSSQIVTWQVTDVRVSVPESLRVSEANAYIPNADIVWREDPFGDRRAQVREIVSAAVKQASAGMEGNQPVYLDIALRRFHALSQKARATVGGQHTILFDVDVRDAATNEPVTAPFPVEIKLHAFGGQRAIEAEMQGETQKVRISREITSVMRRYLGT